MIILQKANKNKSCSLFPNQSNIEGRNKKNQLKKLKNKKKHIRSVGKPFKLMNQVTWASTSNP